MWSIRVLIRASAWTWLLLFALIPCISAQASGSLADRLQAAADESAIDVTGLSPWHMIVDVHLFDSTGKSLEQGTIEAWWVSDQLHKVTYAFPSYSGSELQNRDGAFHSKDQTFEPAILLDVLHQFVHPMKLGELDSTKPDLRKEKFGKVPLECIMLDQPLKTVAYPPLGLFPTYCLDPGKDSLRITTELGSITFIRNRTGRFQNRSVPVDLSGDSDGVVLVTAHLRSLSSMKETDADFSVGPEMESTNANLARIGAGVMAGAILSKPQPVYPQSAKTNHVQGTVVLRAMIGIDGHIHSLHIVSTPDSDLAIAAVAAVRKWTYRPYILNGLPTEVDTTITVNFAFGPG